LISGTARNYEQNEKMPKALRCSPHRGWGLGMPLPRKFFRISSQQEMYFTAFLCASETAV